MKLTKPARPFEVERVGLLVAVCTFVGVRRERPPATARARARRRDTPCARRDGDRVDLAGLVEAALAPSFRSKAATSPSRASRRSP